jgi:hypothetical protein
MSRDVFWAIENGEFGFYCMTALTRREAVAGHVWFFYEEWPRRPSRSEANKLWRECRKRGDRAVKVRVSKLESDK